MKKLLLLLSLLIIASTIFGQNQIPIPSTKNTIPIAKQKAIFQDINLLHQNKTINQRWYSPYLAIDNLLGNVGTLSSDYLFPDTTMLLGNTPPNQVPHTWIHGIGECLDPHSDWFSPLPGQVLYEINEYMPYYLDYIGVYGIYKRIPTSTAVDTLVIYIAEREQNYLYWSMPSSPWVMQNYGTDTLKFANLEFDTYTQFPYQNLSSNSQIIKIPLTTAVYEDTLPSGIQYIQKHTSNFQISADHDVTIQIAFIPGYTWTAHQDSISQVNSFQFLSMEENGDAGGNGTYPSYTKDDYTASFILPATWMYDPSYSVYAPSYFFQQEYPYEHHLIDFRLTDSPSTYKTIQVPSPLLFHKNGPPQTISVYSDAPWVAQSSDTSWLTINHTSSGAGSKLCQVTCTDNQTGTLRTGSITFTCLDSTIQPVSTNVKQYFADNIDEITTSIAHSVFPNPSNGNSTIEFDLLVSESVNIEFYDVRGERLLIIDKGMLASGSQKINFDISHFEDGIYFYKLQAGNKTAFGKFIKQ